MSDIRCRDSEDLTHYKDTGFDVECSLERGLVCYSTTLPCPDFEISVRCECGKFSKSLLNSCTNDVWLNSKLTLFLKAEYCIVICHDAKTA